MGKLKNQLNLIKYYHKYHHDRCAEINQKYQEVNNVFELLFNNIERFRLFGDGGIVKLVSLEATGALKYWGYMRQLLNSYDIKFEMRIRKGATDLVNSLLNYGYALLYARIWQAILAARLNPSESIIHANQHGKPTLVYDLVELFRSQAVDRLVMRLIHQKQLLSMEKQLLSEKTKQQLISSFFERINRYELYRGKRLTLQQVIQEQVKEFAAYIADNKSSYKPYIAKW